MTKRSKQREQFLSDLLVTAVEHGGYGFSTREEYRPEPDGEPAGTYAVIRDRYDEDRATRRQTWRVDLDTMARGLRIIREAVPKVDERHPRDGEVLHNRETGQRLYLHPDVRADLLAADRTNGDEGDIDVIGALAVLECALFGAVIYN